MWGGLLFNGSGFRVECEITLAVWVKPKDQGAGEMGVICMPSLRDIGGGEDWKGLVLPERKGEDFITWWPKSWS